MDNEHKVSLAEAVKQKLEQKKQAQSNSGKQQKHGPSTNQQMKSQINKRQNNQRRRTGV
ncbi:MAG: hypothetical protein K0Q59_751 [Paenibacillus sp.]|nr:hypothetical protein [Paenibacillus sp.]